jgi:GNAT superfamily N-acetyltransferase
VIFIAFNTGAHALGFTQLFPSFSSGRAAPIYILNDLFVTPIARRRGVATQLLRRAAEFGRAEGAVCMRLSTEIGNHEAKTLYESLGWEPETAFCGYRLSI